jgi:UDP-glucose-4-epimerase
MKVLVTGGLGYIGSITCVSLIENKMEVVIADNLYNAKLEVLDRIQEITGIKPTFYNIDVANKVELEKVFKAEHLDAIIHFAGYKAVGESTYKPLEYYENNLDTTFALLSCMAKYKVNNFVFSSSATVYGLPIHVPALETDPVQSATSPYGESKVMNERILTDISKVHKEYNIALLRYFNPIGAHQSGLLGDNPNGIPNNLLPYVSQVATGVLPELKVYGNDYPTPDGTCVRDYIHVCDLAYGHVLALKKLSSNPGLVIYNLGTGKGSSVFDIIHAYEKATGIKIKYSIGPRRPGDVPENYANCDKAKKELGFFPKYSVEDACRDAIRFQEKENKRKK